MAPKKPDDRNSDLTVTVLGCGNSAGVPAVGNYWGNCDPAEPKNIRTRPSIAVRSEKTTLVVDTGPDFRMQLNRENIERVDAVLYTHAHGDHIAGIDDLRVLRNRQKHLIDIYGSDATIDELRHRYDYMFVQKAVFYPKVLKEHSLEDRLYKENKIGDISFMPFEQEHGTMKSLGYRFGDFAYSTDVADFDDKAIESLTGINTWIIDGAGYKFDENKAHLSLRRVQKYIDIVQPDKAYLTHLTPSMDYNRLCKNLPPEIRPAYDGLEIAVRY